MTYKALTVAAAACALALFAIGSPAQADERPSTRTHAKGDMAKAKSKRLTRVRGFVARGGYYSYSDSDVINTYEGSRTRFGGTNFYRDPFLDRQTTSGPFDHGFFFDSGMGPRGGDAPYPNH